jgi:G:T-mismatch repair DNA endonuclease (very short patch repair protein)
LESPIGQVPAAGYVKQENFSKESIQWLEWIMEANRQGGEPITIQHALNKGEFHIPGTNYRADGYCEATNTIYEFEGCLWHGCPTCFSDRDVKHPRTREPSEVLYVKTMKRRAELEALGYKVVSLWEHEFHEMKKGNSKMSKYVDNLDLQDRLEPRDSFFGGRTNAVRLHYRVQSGEQIHYIDFTSLYPWVNKYMMYPVGHPDIITENFKPITEYECGIAKVKVLPPRGLYHPVLPYTSQGKLKFPLCKSCADREQQSPCQCSDSDRAIVGVWCTPELHKALEKGYKILTTYEVYHWPKYTKYDRTTGEGGLFTTYVNTFLKFKQQASDWPEWCKTEEDKKKYLSDYALNEGIQLDWDTIERNPGLRSVAKLCLNSFWGKWGQRMNLKQSGYIYEVDEFYQYVTDPTKEIIDFHIINEDTIQVEWEHKDEFIPDDTRTNIFLATFTTCWARLKLYSVLEALGRSVLYFDTDSVIHVSRPGAPDPLRGDYLGQLTDELDGAYIEEFVSGGPKNYAYHTSTGNEVCKVRGFTLNYKNSQLINFESVRDMILSQDYTNSITTTNPHKICRNKQSRTIFNREEKKNYGVVYTKRVIQEDFDTLPYGY